MISDAAVSESPGCREDRKKSEYNEYKWVFESQRLMNMNTEWTTDSWIWILSGCWITNMHEYWIFHEYFQYFQSAHSCGGGSRDHFSLSWIVNRELELGHGCRLVEYMDRTQGPTVGIAQNLPATLPWIKRASWEAILAVAQESGQRSYRSDNPVIHSKPEW